MNKRERVMAVVRGGQPDHVPSGFWLHFPSGCEGGRASEDIHMDFFERTGTDLCKVMNENLLPRDTSIKTAADWSRVKPFDRRAKHIRDQIDLVKRVTDRVAGEAVVLATIHGAAASISHVLGSGSLYDRDKLLQVRHLRENPSGMRAAFEAVTEILQYLAEECIRSGADGIYYAALGGETYGYSREEFDGLIRPSDLAIMEAAKDRPCFNVLHICKDRIDLSKYVGYPGEVVNWGVYSDNCSLEEGRRYFPGKVILGGLEDRAGVLVSGTLDEIEREVRGIIDGFGAQGFMLGADCTLPTEIDYARIRRAVGAAAEYGNRCGQS